MVSRLALRPEVVALSFDMVGDAGFDGSFGAAVGVGGTDGAFFGNGDHMGKASRVAIDGGRGGEDDVGDIVLCHRREEADGPVDICAIVLQRNLTRFANCLRLISKTSLMPVFMLATLCIGASVTYLESGKVNHTVDIRVRFEDLIQSARDGDVHIVEARPLAADELDAIDGFFRRVPEVISNYDLITSFQKGEGGKGANVTGSPGR